MNEMSGSLSGIFVLDL